MFDRDSLRARLHHSIRREFTSSLAKYFREQPARINDPDLELHIKSLLKEMDELLVAVDCCIAGKDDTK